MEVSVEDSSLRSFLICQIGDKKFAIDVFYVQEVTNFMQVTPVYLSPDHVLGVINLRGLIVTVLDCRLKLRANLDIVASEPKIVVVDCGEEAVGLLVDETIEIYNIPGKSVSSPPENMELDQIALIENVCVYDDEVIGIINLAEITSGKDR